MRKFLVLLIMVVALLPIAAQNQNFKVENNKLIWQKVYKSNLDFNKIFDAANISGRFSELQILDSVIIGKFYDMAADYSGAGFSRGGVPIYVSTNLVNGSFKIEFKAGRYRVTAYNLQLTQSQENGLTVVGSKTNIEDFAVKNGMLKRAFSKKPSQIYDFTFSSMFKFKEKKKSDNW